jgi:hypothetical protein
MSNGKTCQVIPIREISMNIELDKSLTLGITTPSSLKELDFHLTVCILNHPNPL